MLEVEITTECKPHQHLFVIHISSVLEAPAIAQDIVCHVCNRKTRIRKVGVPGRIQREDKPKSGNQGELFKE